VTVALAAVERHLKANTTKKKKKKKGPRPKQAASSRLGARANGSRVLAPLE
jgi:hypothetical protein